MGKCPDSKTLSLAFNSFLFELERLKRNARLHLMIRVPPVTWNSCEFTRWKWTLCYRHRVCVSNKYYP